ncbi:MAG: homoserine kinase [Bacteroidetes bacterium]|nr:homoserine kinase [Bacteroidota bacterium]MCH8523746.1 homoserine kinase [Balneolales bacterium]
MKTTEITVFASATVANVACGFDSLGFAINQPGDEVTMQRTDSGEVRVTAITGDNGRLPLEARKNTASVAVLTMMEELRRRGHEHAHAGFDMQVKKMMPLGSGLGSSAASSVAAIVAANTLLGEPFTREELLPFVMESEKIACGAAHADNVAPALLGGFVLVRSYDPLDVVQLHVPSDLWCAVVHPHIELLTEDARKVLKKNIRLDDAVVQWSNLAGLITGLMKEDYELIGRSLDDIIFEPVRSLLIPGFDAVKGEALASGALGCSISGSGPSIFALCRGEDKAREVGRAMVAAFEPYQLGTDLFVSQVNHQGPEIR